jgi:uncharacterized membrane protein YfcA
VAIPLLTLVVGIQVATPVVGLTAGALTLLILAQNWRQVEMGVTWRLTLAAAFGIPLGVWGLKHLPDEWTTAALGFLLIGIGTYNLTQPSLLTLEGSRWTYLFGFLAGILGGAYNMAGPPMIVYGAMSRWPPAQFRATLQGFFRR